MKVQAIRFDAKRFTVAQAKKWLSDNNYKPTIFEPASGSKMKDLKLKYSESQPRDEQGRFGSTGGGGSGGGGGGGNGGGGGDGGNGGGGEEGGGDSGSGSSISDAGGSINEMGTQLSWRNEEEIRGQVVIETPDNVATGDFSKGEVSGFIKRDLGRSQIIRSIESENDIEQINIKKMETGKGYIIAHVSIVPSADAWSRELDFQDEAAETEAYYQERHTLEKQKVEKCGYGMAEMGPMVPMGITSFAQLQATKTAAEATGEVYELASQFQGIVNNIMTDSMLEDKAAAVTNAAAEFATLVDQAMSGEEESKEKAYLATGFHNIVADYYELADKGLVEL